MINGLERFNQFRDIDFIRDEIKSLKKELNKKKLNTYVWYLITDRLIELNKREKEEFEENGII